MRRLNMRTRRVFHLKIRRFLAFIFFAVILLCGSAHASDVVPPLNSATLTIVSAATFHGENFAPESIAVAFGTALASSTEIAQTASLPSTLAGIQVLVSDSANNVRAAGLFFVSPA